MAAITVPLIPGGVAIVDAADADLIAGFTWRLVGPRDNRYAQAQRGKMYVYMHRLIAGAGPDEIVDHINGDRLDNRSANLRLCSQALNAANRGPDRRRLGTTSRHKGVSWSKSREKWCAYIHVNGKTRSLGRFVTEREAAEAYNRAAVEAWGEYARLNIIEEKGEADEACDPQ